MRWLTQALGAVLLLALFACGGKPLPLDKANYAGEWRAQDMYLVITPDGSVRYERRKGQSSTSVEGPIKEFQGNNFLVGVGPLTTTFVVTKPPYQEGGEWKMVVDDVELTRKGSTA